MSSLAVPTPFHGDLFLLIVALVLLAAPIWVGPLSLDETTYTYERAAVSIEQGDVRYEDGAAIRSPISDEIACSGDLLIDGDLRRCALERYLLEHDDAVYAGISGTTDGRIAGVGATRVSEPYVLINGTLYEATYESGDENDDGYHPLYLDLERADPETVFADVSIDATDRERLPSVVLEALEEGSARTNEEVDVPATTIEDDGRYYRVAEVGRSPPSDSDESLAGLARYGGPFAGLLLLAILSRRVHVEIEYIGDDGRF